MMCTVGLILIGLFTGVLAKEQRGMHSILTEQLLTDYGPTSARPVTDVEKRIDVFIDLQVQRVIELNERAQTLQQSSYLSLRWHDDYLAWNTTMYPKVRVLTIPTEKIWRPDIHLFENVDRNFESLKDVGAFVFPDGTVQWTAPAILHTSCQIDARKFPFDTQYCTLRFSSWTYNKDQLNMVPSNATSVGMYFIENGIWKLIDIRVKTIENVYPEGVFREVLYTVLVERRPLFHILSFILPCALLSLLNLLAFLLPTESGEKVSLGITNLLALVLFQQLISDSLPPSSSNMPIISYYFAPMILIGCLSIVSGVFVAALYHQRRSRPIPDWLRKLTRVPLSTAPVPISSDLEFESQLTKETPDLTPVKSLNSGLHDDHSEQGKRISNGIDVTSIAYPMVQQEGSRLHNGVYDYRADWCLVATSIDHMMLAVGVAITSAAVVVTVVLFGTSETDY